ncbi:MAG: glycoside hydrolase family 172 protein [Bacteroidota bacterium]
MKQITITSLSLLIAILAGCGNREKRDVYPTGSMEYPERAITQRASSYDTVDWENGNADARRFDPGQSRVLADLSGPGRITHIWFTAAGYERGFPRSVVIRMYWDGSEAPAVEVPLGDFFAAGHGMQVDVNSSRVATSSFGRAYNSYWNMPFRKSARITVTNESVTDTMGLYWYVDWEQRAVPKDIPYFHARYLQENPVQPGKDYLIADIEGKGHYVGTVLSVRMSQPGWFGEGDDRFYIDGDSLPTLHGTGSEDYINDAWAFRQVKRPHYGVSIWEGMNTGGRITAYRWHVTDPVFFNTSLKFTIEHKGNTFYEDQTLVDAFTDRRPDFYSSVAFWYQTGEAKKGSGFPPVHERMYPFELIQVDEVLKEQLPGNTGIYEDINLTNRYGLHYTPAGEGDALEIPFQVEKNGDFIVFARVHPRADAGTYDFYLDGTLMAVAVDMKKEHHFVTDIKLGHMHSLEKGEHIIKAVYRGTSKPGTPGNLFVDAIVLEKAGEFEIK